MDKNYKVCKIYIKPKRDIHNIKVCAELCSASNQLYNHCNNIINQWFKSHQTYWITPEQAENLGFSIKQNSRIFNLATLFHLVKNHPTFHVLINQKRVNTKALKQTLKSVEETWKGYLSALKEFYSDKKKFKAKPKTPKLRLSTSQYKITFPSDAVSTRKKGYITLGNSDFVLLNHLNLKRYEIKEVEIRPVGYGYYVSIVYDRKERIAKLESINNRFLSIDYGVKNPVTCVSNDPLIQSVIYGTEVKNANRAYWYALEKAKLQLPEGVKTSQKIKRITINRNHRVDTAIHADTRRITEYCVKNNIQEVIIGKNIDWKQKSNIGKRNNVRFQFIPYDRYNRCLEYKLNRAGISVCFTEESYTSKCSFMDNEDICKHEVYMGRRAKRGLFIDSVGRRINADVNGALNIMRKVKGNDIFNVNRELYLRINPKKMRNNDGQNEACPR